LEEINPFWLLPSHLSKAHSNKEKYGEETSSTPKRNANLVVKWKCSAELSKEMKTKK